MEYLHDDDREAKSRRGSIHESAERDRSSGQHAPTPSQLPNRAAAVLLGGGSRRIDRKAERSQGAGPLDEDIGADIAAARGGGRALDDSTRTDMEGHLGVGLSSVRIHSDSRGDQLSRSVQAEAFTTGTDVFFREGRYQPGSNDGRRLLAHELTHVVQQSSGQGGEAGAVSHPGDSHEVEASAVGDSVAASAPISRSAEPEEELGDPVDTAVAREAEEEVEEEELSP